MWPHDFGHSGLSAGDLHHYHSGSAAIVHLLRRRRGQGPSTSQPPHPAAPPDPRERYLFAVRTVLICRENGTCSSRERYLLAVRTAEVASRHRALAAPGAPSLAGASTWTRGPALRHLLPRAICGPPPGVRADQPGLKPSKLDTHKAATWGTRGPAAGQPTVGTDARAPPPYGPRGAPPSPWARTRRVTVAPDLRGPATVTVGTDATPPGRTKTGRPSAGLRRAARSGRGDQRGRRRRPGPGRSRSASAGHGQGTGPVLTTNKYRSHGQQVPFSRAISTVLAGRAAGAGEATGPQRQDVRRCRGRS